MVSNELPTPPPQETPKPITATPPVEQITVARAEPVPTLTPDTIETRLNQDASQTAQSQTEGGATQMAENNDPYGFNRTIRSNQESMGTKQVEARFRESERKQQEIGDAELSGKFQRMIAEISTNPNFKHQISEERQQIWDQEIADFLKNPSKSVSIKIDLINIGRSLARGTPDDERPTLLKSGIYGILTKVGFMEAPDVTPASPPETVETNEIGDFLNNPPPKKAPDVITPPVAPPAPPAPPKPPGV